LFVSWLFGLEWFFFEYFFSFSLPLSHFTNNHPARCRGRWRVDLTFAQLCQHSQPQLEQGTVPFSLKIALSPSGTLLGVALAMLFRHKPGTRVCPVRIIVSQSHQSFYIFFV